MRIWYFVAALAALALSTSTAFAVSIVDSADVQVTNDNNNVDGGTPNPSFDAQNRQSNETSVAVSPADASIVAIGANDYRMVPVIGDGWLGFYVSNDGGATWFNTMVPGFPSDTSAAGLASPLLGLDGSGDPVVRFDAAGNLYVAGIAFNRDFDQVDLNNDTVVYVARYDYTPGTSGGVSTSTSAASPPNFTYAQTTIVDRGAIGFAIPPGQRFGFAGIFDDKNWMAVDTYQFSPCFGTIYYSYTKFSGLAGQFAIQLATSDDDGVTFNEPRAVSQKGKDGSVSTQGSNLAVAADGRVYLSYRTFPTNSDPTFKISVVSSYDCGKRWGKPVTAAVFDEMARNEAGLSFRTPTESWIAVSDLDSSRVFVSYMALNSAGNADILVARSADGAKTFGAPVTVNDDGGPKHQFWPALAVSNGVLHAAWFDFRNSPGDTAQTNDALDVYYSFSSDGATWSTNQRVSDVSHQPNCLMFGGGTSAFHGDYIELAAHYDAGVHTVHVAWPDNRDVPAGQCDLDPAAGPASNSIGNRNQNIYASTLTVTP